MADEDEAFDNKKVLVRSASHMYDELRSFRTWFKWMCVDQSNPWSACLSWFVFSLLAVVVPWLSHYLLACRDCDADHSRTYDSVVQLSLSSVAALSFICLSRFNKKYGLRRFLFLDKLCDESETVRNCYTQQLNLCSVSLLAGLMILLRSATRITHKAQAVTCLAAKWHACATIDSYHWAETDIPPEAHLVDCNNDFPPSSLGSSDAEDVGDEEDELDNTKFVPSYAYSTISFQKRQALVTYFQNNRAGVTIYGFMLDRTSLHTIFGIELTLMLWLLGKTVGVS